MNTAALLGVPRIPLRFERLARTRAPVRLTVGCTSSGELRRERQYRGDEASSAAEEKKEVE